MKQDESTFKETAGLFLLHLRLPFQLMLAPIFFAGALASGHRPHLSWAVPFLAVHFGLYGGATALNSFYDQDRGPIGFWKRPRPATCRVRDLAVVLQVLAILLLSRGGLAPAAIALVMMGMGLAYSHPATRWKASAWGGLAAVAIGQGLGAVLLGFYCTGGHGFPGARVWSSALGAALCTAGLYPVTQVYQIDEDRSRGDFTVPVRYGWRAALWLSGACTAAGLFTLALSLRSVLPRFGAAVVASLPLPFAAVLLVWSRRFEKQSSFRNHDWAMAIGAGAALLFWLLFGAGLASAGTVRVWAENGRTRVETSAWAPCSPQQAWTVVLDYDALPRFMPSIDSSRVLRRVDDTALVHQVGTGRFVIRKHMQFDLEFRRQDAQRVDFRQTRGDFKEFSGFWSVVPDSGGVRISFSSALRSSLLLPGPLVRRVIRRQARLMMPALVGEIARRFPPAVREIPPHFTPQTEDQ